MSSSSSLFSHLQMIVIIAAVLACLLASSLGDEIAQGGIRSSHLQQKRFYSWEEGKRSAPFADREPLSLLEQEDPWRRMFYAWANSKKSPAVVDYRVPTQSVVVPKNLQMPRFFF